MRQDLKWDDVRLFLAAMRERTLAGAGARLGIDASTVSRRLSAFEAALGNALFDRTRDGLAPTAAAEQLLVSAEDMEAAAFRLSRAAEGAEVAPEGLVRITAFEGLAEGFVVPELPRIRERYPGIRFELDISSTVADLNRREADIALRLMRPTSGDLVCARVLTLDYAVLASRSFALEIGEPRSLSSLPWISLISPTAQDRWSEWMNRHAPGVVPVLRTASIEAQIVAIENQVGVALLPSLYTSLRGLVEIPLTGALSAAKEALPAAPVWLVGHQALRGVPRISAVWSHLLEAGKRAPATSRPSST